MLEKALNWLAKWREQHWSVTVRYITKDGVATTCTATLGETEFNAPDDHGIYVRMVYRDFLISDATLRHTPELGDTIHWNGSVYEVLAPEFRCVWRWSDPYRVTKRIHTKYLRELTSAEIDSGSGDSGSGGSGSGGSGSGGSGSGGDGSGSGSGGCCCPMRKTVTIEVCACCQKGATCPTRMKA